MNFRAGVLLLCLAAALAVGCRKPLAPNIDRNRAPETWITAAPQDTITQKNKDGSLTNPSVGTIAVRFHLYWAGSDADGAVVGFYYAVVETTATPPLPPLPGPKPSDYHFTTKSDSTFIFSVSEELPDREHTFYIYAVDDKGKGDPTPARLIFNALDRFPPKPVLEVSSATGPIADLRTGGTKDTTVLIEDQNTIGPARDTVPSRARIDFRWHGEPAVAGSYVVGYRYKLDEPDFVSADSSVHSKSYNTGLNGDVTLPGNKVFTLRAVDVASGAGVTKRHFYMNYAPDTWFAGPDTTFYPFKPDPSDPTGPQQRLVSVPIGGWATQPFPGSLLSCDSLYLLPHQRAQNHTFFEIYQNSVYAHREYDTVHMNSWIVLQAGGYDKDSPYNVNVNKNDPVKDTVTCNQGIAKALRPAGINGSPVAFRYRIGILLDPDRRVLGQPTQSGIYPIFDATSVFRAPTISAYLNVPQSGRMYVILKAEDSDGVLDDRIGSAAQAKTIVSHVDACDHCGTDVEQALRTRILTFDVDREPFFNFEDPSFFPKPPAYNGGQADSTIGRVLSLHFRATDLDPYDSANRPSPGGPSPTTQLRYRVWITGKTAEARDTTFLADSTFTNQLYSKTVYLTEAPLSSIVSQDLTLTIELCDCPHCEEILGSGRCVNYTIPVRVGPVTSSQAAEPGTWNTPAPGASNPSGRSYSP